MNATNDSKISRVLRQVFYEDLNTPLQACRLDSSSISCLIANINGAVTGCVLPAVMIVGLLGNCLVAYMTLCRVKPLTLQNCFYGCIAVADATTLTVQGLFSVFLNRGLPWLTNGRLGFVMFNASDLSCKVSKAAVGLTQLLPAALMLVLVGNRTATFLAPLRFHGRSGARGALLPMLAATAISVLLALPRGIASRLISRYFLEQELVIIYCYFSPGIQYEMLLYDSLVCSPPTIVLLLLLVLNSILLGCVLRARKRREQLTADSSRSVRGSAGVRNEADSAVVILAMSSTTLALYLPMPIVFWAVHLLENTLVNSTARIWIDILYLLKTLAMSNQALNWVILLGCSSKMRQEVKGMFGFRSVG